MRLRLSQYLLETLLTLCGRHAELWEALLSEACGFEVQLPRFFWEVEVFLLHAERPRRVTLLCHPPRGFFGQKPGKDYAATLQAHVLSSVYRYVSRLRNSAAATNGNGHTLLWLPSRSGVFPVWESAQ